jgi:uncharacterized membrane protein
MCVSVFPLSCIVCTLSFSKYTLAMNGTPMFVASMFLLWLLYDISRMSMRVTVCDPPMLYVVHVRYHVFSMFSMFSMLYGVYLLSLTLITLVFSHISFCMYIVYVYFAEIRSFRHL